MEPAPSDATGFPMPMVIPIPFDSSVSACPVCRSQFATYSNLLRHCKRSCHTPIPNFSHIFQCKFCDLSSEDAKTIGKHQKKSPRCQELAQAQPPATADKPHKIHRMRSARTGVVQPSSLPVPTTSEARRSLAVDSLLEAAGQLSSILSTPRRQAGANDDLGSTAPLPVLPTCQAKSPFVVDTLPEAAGQLSSMLSHPRSWAGSDEDSGPTLPPIMNTALPTPHNTYFSEHNYVVNRHTATGAETSRHVRRLSTTERAPTPGESRQSSTTINRHLEHPGSHEAPVATTFSLNAANEPEILAATGAPLTPGPAGPSTAEGDPSLDRQQATQTTASGDNDLPAHTRLWMERFDACACPQELDDLSAELTQAIRDFTQSPAQGARVPNAGPNPISQPVRAPLNQARPPRRHLDAYDPQQAAKLQRLYRSNRKRAMREILQGESPYCTIDRGSITSHFKQEAVDSNPIFRPPRPLRDPDDDDPLGDPFSPEEVARRLKKASNTAPGPDRVNYNMLKKFDSDGLVMASLFNATQRCGTVPTSWKESTTILIHKKGPRDDVSNWRPIALSNTMCKLYSGCLAGRIATWSVFHDRLGIHQKGFLQYQGCLEHNFLLQTAIQDARRRRKDIVVVWLDLTNAFGSIPHDTIWKSLRWHGLSLNSINTIKGFFSHCSTSVRTADGLTDPIPFLRGVKQGCPLSPIIFNLAIEPILSELVELQGGFVLDNRPLNVLAYADDIALLSSDANSMSDTLSRLSELATAAGLSFNARKCASLHVRGKEHKAIPSKFLIQGNSMTTCTSLDTYCHLGVPTGFSLQATGAETISKIKADVHTIDKCLLAPWQKIDAVNTFIVPRLSFALKCDFVEKRQLNELDKTIRKCAKSWLNLPDRASTEPLYMSNFEGGANILPLNKFADISLVCHAIQLFESKDPSIRQSASESLKRVVEKRVGRSDDETLHEYLCGSMEDDFLHGANDIRSTWSRLRIASRKLVSSLGLDWKVCNGIPTAQLDEMPLIRKSCEHHLRTACRATFRESLISKPDQGKVFDVSTTSSFSNHFMQGGKFCRFADWKFIHRARLGVVPLNGCRRFGQGDKRCRRCGHEKETLPHVLNHCMRHSRAMTMRHDAILHRLVNAVDHTRASEVRMNRTIPSTGSNLRPDLFVKWENDRKITIVDVTVPFENRLMAFEAAREEKLTKYAEIKRTLEDQGYTVYLDAFIIGALGSFDIRNAGCIRHLRISKRYSSLMLKLMVSDTIRWSRDIYVEHLTGVRQYTIDGSESHELRVRQNNINEEALGNPQMGIRQPANDGTMSHDQLPNTNSEDSGNPPTQSRPSTSDEMLTHNQPSTTNLEEDSGNPPTQNRPSTSDRTMSDVQPSHTDGEEVPQELTGPMLTTFNQLSTLPKNNS